MYFQDICIIPKSAFSQTKCSNDKCRNQLANYDSNWYNQETNSFLCFECGENDNQNANEIDSKMKKCFALFPKKDAIEKSLNECPICLNLIKDLALLPCGHGMMTANKIRIMS